MMSTKALPKSLAVVGLALITAGCTLSKQDAGTYRTTLENQGRVTTEIAAFENVEPVRVSFQDMTEFEEYTLFRSERGQSEILFVEVPERRTFNYVLDFNKLVSSTVPMWRFNQNTELSFQPSRSITNRLGDFWMREYTQTGNGRACVGFVGAWDLNFSDPQIRPTKALFGYYCRPRGVELTSEDAENFIKSIDIRGISIPMRVESAYALTKDTAAPTRAEQVASLVKAQDGVAGGISGLPAFPLLIARSFPIGDSCPISGC